MTFGNAVTSYSILMLTSHALGMHLTIQTHNRSNGLFALTATRNVPGTFGFVLERPSLDELALGPATK